MGRTVLHRIVAVIALTLLPSLVFANKPLDDTQKARILNKTYRMQIPFIENKGQIGNNDVSFYAKTFGGTLYVEKDGTLAYSLPYNDKGSVIIKEMLTDNKIEIKGLDPSPTKVNYFKGKDPSKWKRNIPSYNSVSLGEIHKGIELTLKAYGKNVEKLFTVSPQANPEFIKVKLKGAKELQLNNKGELEVITEHGPVAFTKPKAYQEINEKRVEVNVSYKLLNSAIQNPQSIADFQPHSIKNSINSNPKSKIQNPKSYFYGFKVGDYNKNYPLTIDPLLASTFIGGSSEDYGHSFALDGSGNVYIAGQTDSSDYPTTAGGYDETYNGGTYDVVVSKLNNDLSDLEASTFIGGVNLDRGYSITLDGSGNVYITGNTTSSDYPTTSGAYDKTYDGGAQNVFLSKLDSSLGSLLASTFVGEGSTSYSIALDESGAVYITGNTNFTGYPTTSGAYDESYNGGTNDAYVSKLKNDLSGPLLASTFIGGVDSDWAYSITPDGSGNVYVTGYTFSSDYPTTPGAYDEILNGGQDVFITKLNSDLSDLSASTFIGGVNSDIGRSLALDGSGNVYVTGYTYSSDYPTTPGAYNERFTGGNDVFVSRLDGDLSSLLASTFVGGGGGYSLALDGCGNIYVTGRAFSYYPTTPGAYDESHNGGVDVFVSKLNGSLGYLFQSTLVGGWSNDQCTSIALDMSGSVYINGYTPSTDYPTTAGAYDESYNGGIWGDVFVSKLDNFLSAPPPPPSRPARSAFLTDPDVSFVYDADMDGSLDVGCTQFLLCKGQVAEVDIWLNGIGQTIEDVDYYFTWDPNKLTVTDIICNDSEWDTICNEPDLTSYTCNNPPNCEYNLHVNDSSGLPVPVKLHTVKFVAEEVITPFTAIDTTTIQGGGSITPTLTVGDSTIYVSAICGGEPFTCDELDNCDIILDQCPDGVDVTVREDKYYWEPEGTLCEGNIININLKKMGTYEVTESCTESMCDDDCFNNCYNNCGDAQVQECALQCTKACKCRSCENLQENCDEYMNRIYCSTSCYNQCNNNFDPATYEATYDKYCGFSIKETIDIRPCSGSCTGSCNGTPITDSFVLDRIGSASIIRDLPLDAGKYEICIESTPIEGWDSDTGTSLGEEVEVLDCGGGSLCSIGIPNNPFYVNQGVDTTLADIKVKSNADGAYNLSLDWRDYNQESLPYPSYLQVPASVTLAYNGASGLYEGSFNLTATDPQPDGVQTHWANLIIQAEKIGDPSVSCEAYFDFDIRNISANYDCKWDDDFVEGSTVYGFAKLGLSSNQSYDLYVLTSQTNWINGTDLTALTRASGSATTFTTDDNGDMGCGTCENCRTVLWETTLAGSYDIVIDVNDNGQFDANVDYLDANGGVGFTVCTDGDLDGDMFECIDNCPEDSNPKQEDTMPPGGNNCGDACECEGDLYIDGGVDGLDLAIFNQDYNRGTYWRPCTNGDPCNGDVDCSGGVDGLDLAIFNQDYNRGAYWRPCPDCETDPWCVY